MIRDLIQKLGDPAYAPPKPKQWYTVVVACESTEAFEGQASSPEEALEMYERGDMTLRRDEVDSRIPLFVRKHKGDVSWPVHEGMVVK
jgi:hypothetical protein